MIKKHILFWNALLLLSAIPAYSVTDGIIGPGQSTLPTKPSRPRPNPHVSVTPIPEAMALSVEIPEGGVETVITLQNFTSGEVFVIVVRQSCQISIPSSSGVWVVSMEQSGQPRTSEVVIL